MRLAVFTSHPIQYQVPLFRALAREPAIDLVVFFGCRHGVEPYSDPGFGCTVRWDMPMLGGYEHVFLRNRSRQASADRFFGVRVPEIRRHLVPDRFDALLLLGWYTLGHLQAARAAHRGGFSILLRGESNLEMQLGSILEGWFRRYLWLPLRRPFYKAAFQRVDAIVAIGSRNLEFYRSFGIRPPKLRTATYAVDNRHFSLRGVERSRTRAAIRSRWGIDPDATVFLSVGKLVDYKRPQDLLEAFGRGLGGDDRSILVFVGDGPMRPRLASLISSRPELADRVRITGFVNQKKLPGWYAAADCLVLCSDARETWGLVVNEAMAAGLPVIVSAAAGCAPDLVRDGANGWLYPVGRIEELSRRLTRFRCLPPDARRAMGKASRKRVESVTQESTAKVLANAVLTVARRDRTR